MAVTGSKLTTFCVVCGKPIVAPFVTTGDPVIDSVALKIAGRLAHNRCGEMQFEAKAIEEVAGKAFKRSEHWQLLCPPFYQNSHEWIASEAAKKKLNLKAVAQALQWEFGPLGLILSGNRSGSGKTTAAWAIMHREFLRARFICAMTHVELSNRATRLACEQNKEDRRWADMLKRADIVFLDDLAKSRFTAQSGEGRASEEFLFDLIDHRIKQQKPTVITCNVDGATLKASMSSERGEYLTRRLREFFKSVRFD